ncbi:MAG: hypothetical protein PHR92_09655 [Lachnospiraceae bacterium]|nr:hypothetical protein [Lachnospiraceae bacterium]
MMDLKGKKLLILGASELERLIVERAREWGMYTIVTDYNKNWQDSPAKYAAEEAWDVSWSDQEQLYRLCLEHGVDGVTAGFSEFRVEHAILLCEKLKLPFYASKEQLELTRSKDKFKECCRKYGVPTVPAYEGIHGTEDIDGADIHFPVIVKPVDRAGSIGITICHDKEGLKKANDYALSLSAGKKTIIEKFMAGCSEFNAYYMIQNGKAILSCTADKKNSRKEQGEKIVPNAEIFPSCYQKDFLQKADKNMKAMIEGQNIQNGCIFITGFVDENREFYFFETGFRLSTELSYYFIKSKCRYDALDLILYSSFTGDTSDMDLSDIIQKQDCWAGATLYSYAKKGMIQKIQCSLPENLKAHVNCIARYLREGELAEEKDSTFHNAITGCIHAETKEKLRELVGQYNQQIQILDETGKSLIYDRLQPEEIR